MAELDADGAVLSRFVYAHAPQRAGRMVRGGKTYRLVTDHLGSAAVGRRRGTGAVAQGLDYDEFGRVTAGHEPGLPAVRLRRRPVRPGHRAWCASARATTTPRPGAARRRTRSSFGGGDTNLYAYATSDPINLIDPSGLLLDTLLDIGFIAYDLFDIGRSLMNGCGVSGSQWLSLGADVAGALIPFATGGGAAVRAANQLDNAGDARKIVIGEDMAGRVIPEAKRHGADYYDPPTCRRTSGWTPIASGSTTAWTRAARSSTAGRRRAGRTTRSPTSPYYQMELDEIARRNYPTTRSDRYGQ